MVLVNEFSEFGSNNNLSEVYDPMMTWYDDSMKTSQSSHPGVNIRAIVWHLYEVHTLVLIDYKHKSWVSFTKSVTKMQDII